MYNHIQPLSPWISGDFGCQVEISLIVFLIDVAMAGKSFALLETAWLQVKTATVCVRFNYRR